MPVDQLDDRELDAAVAQRVFGFEVESRIDTRTGERDYFYNAGGPDPQRPVWIRVPFYTASESASITLEVALKQRGWKRVDSNWKDASGRVVLQHADGRMAEAVGRINEALCRAALKALEA